MELLLYNKVFMATKKENMGQEKNGLGREGCFNFQGDGGSKVLWEKKIKPEVLGHFQPYSPCMDDKEKNDSSKEKLLDNTDKGMQNHITSTLHLLDESGTFPTPSFNQEGVLASSSSHVSVSVLGLGYPFVFHKA